MHLMFMFYIILFCKYLIFFSLFLGIITGNQSKILKYLEAKIEATGPISVADYMKETLISPNLVSKTLFRFAFFFFN